MFDYKEKLVKQLQKETHPLTPSKTSKICTSKKSKENSLNTNQDKNKNANPDLHILHIFKSKIKEQFEEKNIDVEIAYKTYEFLTSSGQGTLQEITNYICEGKDPDEITSSHLAMKIDLHLNRLYMNDYLDFNINKYELQESFIELVNNAKGDETC